MTGYPRVMAGKFKDLEEQFDQRRDEQRHGRPDAPEREKRSWRDVDRGKDRSDHSDQSRSPMRQRPDDRYQTAAAQKQLKGQLDALFVDKDALALRQAVLDAQDRIALQDALTAFIAARGALPPDPDLLEKAMTVRKDGLLKHVVEAVGQLLETTDATRKKLFLLTLRSRSRSTFDRTLSRRMKQLLAQHGADA